MIHVQAQLKWTGIVLKVINLVSMAQCKTTEALSGFLFDLFWVKILHCIET